jgi:hypothetical protein
MHTAVDVQRLPIEVRPFSGETVTGYVGRLATANGLAARDLRLHIRDHAGLSATHTNLERAADVVERLGGLPVGHFAKDERRHSMYVRCPHSHWQPGRCRTCGYAQAPRTGCLRCSAGVATTVRTRGGAVCNRHHRWHVAGADLDLSGLPDYTRAERCLSGTLWKRGIGLSTGELQLAATLVRNWLIDSDATDRLGHRRADLGVDGLAPDDVFLFAYPEIVNLTTVLTDMSFASCLLTPRFSLAEQVWALEAAVVTIMHGSTTPRLHDVAERIVSHGKAAVKTAFGMRQKPNNKRPATLEKALIASSQRHRSCVLRHLSTVRIQTATFEPGVAAPKNQVLARRRPLPDLVGT